MIDSTRGDFQTPIIDHERRRLAIEIALEIDTKLRRGELRDLDAAARVIGARVGDAVGDVLIDHQSADLAEVVGMAWRIVELSGPQEREVH